MATADTIPVAVSDDAARRIADLGMQREFEAIVERAKQTLPDLLRIAVTLEGLVHEPETPEKICLNAYRIYADLDEEGRIRGQWSKWWIHLPLTTRLAFLLTHQPAETNGR